MELHSYLGPRPEHRPNSRTSEYGLDTFAQAKKYMDSVHDAEAPECYRLDGDWQYQFNSLGFRCDEYDARADARIFAVGCSNTLGVGVRAAQTWPSVFGALYSSDHPHHSICIMNFAQGSASNDYIARTAVSQCAAARPDLLLVHFTDCARKEHIDGMKITNLLPAGELDELACAFYSSYTADEGLLNAVKNVLLVQLYCDSHHIPYLLCWSDHPRLTPRYARHPVCGPLISLINREHFCAFSLKDKDLVVDLARDLKHPGPRSNEIFAERLYQRFLELAEAKRPSFSPLEMPV
jgi:hypothetical protein